MTTVVDFTLEDLRARRKRLLDRAGMSWDRLSDLAAGYALDVDERNIYETIRGIDYLLADDGTES